MTCACLRLLAFCLTCLAPPVVWAQIPRPEATSSDEVIDEAFQAAQWGFYSSAGSAIQQMQARRAAGDGPLADLLRRRQSLAGLRQRAEAELATLGRDDKANTDALAVRLSGDIDAIRGEIATVDAALARDFPAHDRLTHPSPLSISEAQNALEPDEALLFIYSGERDTYSWAITPSTAAWLRVGLGRASLSDQVANIRATLDPNAATRGAMSLDTADDGPRIAVFNRTEAFLIYAELIAPLIPFLEGTKHIYSVMDGPLSGLPLAVLPSELIPGDDDDPETMRQTPWLFQDYALTSLPSVDSLPLIRQAVGKPKQTQLSLLGFGDPDFRGTALTTSADALMRSGAGDPDGISALAPLPFTRVELNRIAQTLGASERNLYLGKAATEGAVKSADLGTADVIVFATHGLLSGDIKGLAEPALVFSPPQQASGRDDGLLTASEISSLPLDADWVVLSACNTAGSDGRPDAEGLSGLARAFLFAGARSIMVSHWPVRDDAAARLTTGTFENLINAPSGLSKAKALQSAMQSMLTDESDPSLAHPSAWAPFVIVGDGR